MKILGKPEILAAEKALQKHFPKSLKVVLILTLTLYHIQNVKLYNFMLTGLRVPARY